MSINHEVVTLMANEVVRFESKQYDEVTIHFVKTQEIQQLHLDYFNDGSTTDCISFPMDDDDDFLGYRVLGEIFVCPQTALDYAETHKTNSQDELTLYIIHGLLHLMGYDDINLVDRRKMRIAEKKHIKNLKEQQLCL